jgi:hypothetical protein
MQVRFYGVNAATFDAVFYGDHIPRPDDPPEVNRPAPEPPEVLVGPLRGLVVKFLEAEIHRDLKCEKMKGVPTSHEGRPHLPRVA